MGLSIVFNYFGGDDNAIACSHDLNDIAIHAQSYDALALIWEKPYPVSSRLFRTKPLSHYLSPPCGGCSNTAA